MRIAIEGCSHGCLDKIYSSILALDRKAGRSTDLLLLCGDVQTLRNQRDLHCLAVPDKYKALGDFHRYYNGQRKAPILTLMIGGNHEASNYLWELYHGGWVAPNIYYLGAAGCVEVGGLTIAGISGIYKSHDYTRGRFEKMPYNASEVRSVYHTRLYDTYRLRLLSQVAGSSGAPEIVLSHDWPNTIEQYGDVNWLKKKKPFFTDEINSSSLGSPPLWKVLQDLHPKYWFSAHLHVRFAALYKHSGQKTNVVHGSNKYLGSVQRGESNEQSGSQKVELIDESLDIKENNAEEMIIDLDDAAEIVDQGGTSNPEAIEINDDDLDEDPKHDHQSLPRSAAVTESLPLETGTKDGTTRFLALSKCLEGQDFLQVLDIPAPFDTQEDYRKTFPPADDISSPNIQPALRFSLPWLAVTKATHAYLSLEKTQEALPENSIIQKEIEKQSAWLSDRLNTLKAFEGCRILDILDVENTQHFVKTAPASDDPEGAWEGPPPWYTNPQTVALCSLLETPNRINPPPPGPMLIPTSMPPMTVPAAGSELFNEAEEIRRIEEAAQMVMKKRRALEEQDESQPVLTLLDDDESAARWKEGTG